MDHGRRRRRRVPGARCSAASAPQALWSRSSAGRFSEGTRRATCLSRRNEHVVGGRDLEPVGRSPSWKAGVPRARRARTPIAMRATAPESEDPARARPERGHLGSPPAPRRAHPRRAAPPSWRAGRRSSLRAKVFIDASDERTARPLFTSKLGSRARGSFLKRVSRSANASAEQLPPSR